MKKLVVALLVFAMMAFMVPTAFATGESTSIPVKSGTETISETDAIEIFFTPSADGILSVTLSGNPGYKIWVYQVANEGSVGLAKSGAAEATFEYELSGNVEYRVHIAGYYNWSEVAATITYALTFAEQKAAVSLVEIGKSGTALQLGENKINLLENTKVSLYDFIPAEPGIYTITVGDGVMMASYGFAAWNKLDEAENGMLVHTATAAGQTMMIGLSAETASVTVNIEKTGDYIPPVQIEYATYEPSCPVVSDFAEPSGLVSIDISKEQNVVLGSDGYYHLGAANGPVVYVNLNNNQFTLSMLYDAGAPTTMRGCYIDENGESHYYDFIEMIGGDYYKYSRENDYHPLNKDLMIFLKAYGRNQGWYKANTSGFETIQNAEFVEASAWLASCYSTVSSYEPGNNGSLGGGDTSPVDVMIVVALVALCGMAVIIKKKEF